MQSLGVPERRVPSKKAEMPEPRPVQEKVQNIGFRHGPFLRAEAQAEFYNEPARMGRKKPMKISLDLPEGERTFGDKKSILIAKEKLTDGEN